MANLRAFGFATISLIALHGQTFAEEGAEVRAASVCAGIGSTDLSIQGPLHIENLTVSGNGNGTVTVRSSTGVVLGNLPKGSYDKYVDCLTKMTMMLRKDPSGDDLVTPGSVTLRLRKFVQLTDKRILVGVVDFKTVPMNGDAVQVSIDGQRMDMYPGNKRPVPIYGGVCSISLVEIDMQSKRATFTTDCSM